MKVLVVGGLGFIGHWVVRKLEDRGIDCAVIDCKETYETQNQMWMMRVFDSRERQIKSPIHNIDVLDNDAVKTFLLEYQPTHIIYLASPPNQSAVASNLTRASRVMIEGLNNFLRLRTTQRFVYISSSMVYGNFSEPINEDGETNPVNAYGILKLAAENLVRSVNIPYTIIRPSAVYGPRDADDRVIARWLKSSQQGLPLIVNGENEKCDFTWVGDLAWGIVEATVNENGINQTFNLTRGGAVKLTTVAKIISEITNSDSEIIINDLSKDHPSRTTLKIDKAEKELNYNPPTDVETGIKLYWLWLKQYEDSLQQSE
jgi:nucleoside-diphosphate-sugar epimerase